MADGDVSPELIDRLEDIRADVGGPVRLNSGCRCETHNIAVKGAKHSVHMLGEAADIQVEGGRHRYQVQHSAHIFGLEGIGTARTFIHVDVHKGSPDVARPSAWSY